MIQTVEMSGNTLTAQRFGEIAFSLAQDMFHLAFAFVYFPFVCVVNIYGLLILIDKKCH